MMRGDENKCFNIKVFVFEIDINMLQNDLFFILYCLLPVLLLMSGFFSLFYTTITWEWCCIYWIIAFGLAGLFAYMCLYFYFYNVYQRLVHKGKLAKMIHSRRLILERVLKNGRRKVVYEVIPKS